MTDDYETGMRCKDCGSNLIKNNGACGDPECCGSNYDWCTSCGSHDVGLNHAALRAELKVYLDVGGRRYLPCSDVFRGAEYLYVDTYVGKFEFTLYEIRDERDGPPGTRGAFYRLTSFQGMLLAPTTDKEEGS